LHATLPDCFDIHDVECVLSASATIGLGPGFAAIRGVAGLANVSSPSRDSKVLVVKCGYSQLVPDILLGYYYLPLRLGGCERASNDENRQQYAQQNGNSGTFHGFSLLK
jgi:hypothetical protein